ncbi:hypothetical protein RAAC3_TM7C00001G0934 [Candidatus Saccharibacteria bacterium RAAC3_TM7_1]|nr:hypothetical protein RAAC3_TM7C00001G0934 [Candidatus Saccharibacteria bacterium RAAC3_TM7_1]
MENSTYPSALSDIDVASSVVTYQYGTDGATYCLSATSGSVSHYTTGSSLDSGTCTESGGIVGWWKLNGNGTDNSLGGNNGTVDGAITTTNANGASGMAYVFNGTSDYIHINDNANLRVGAPGVTLAAWLKPVSISGCTVTTPCIIMNKENSYEVALISDGSIYYAFANTSPGWAWRNTGMVASSAQWSHFVITYDGTTIKGYLNGSWQYTLSGSGNFASNANALRIAARGGNGTVSAFLASTIDDVRIYNRPLGSSEVQSLASAGPQ